MAAILIGVIAVIGIAVLRFSNASSVTKTYADKVTQSGFAGGIGNVSCMNMQSSGQWCWVGEYKSGLHKHQRSSDGQCAFMSSYGSKGSNLGSTSAGNWVTINETTSCDI